MIKWKRIEPEEYENMTLEFLANMVTIKVWNDIFQKDYTYRVDIHVKKIKIFLADKY